MTSISQIQRQSILEYIARQMYSTGTKPRLNDIFFELSKYFGENPAGLPVQTELERNGSGTRSEVKEINDSMAKAIFNIYILYRTNAGHMQQLLELNTILRSHLDSLSARRMSLMNKVDDHLLSLYNTDGYFYSISDGFADLSKVELSMSSAFVDIKSNKVSLPIRSTTNATLDISKGINASVSVKSGSTDQPLSHYVTGHINSAFDGLTNTVWGFEVSSDQQEEVLATVTINWDHTATNNNSKEVSRIEFDPFGSTPVQTAIYTKSGISDKILYGNKIATINSRTAFIDAKRTIDSLILELRKSEPDYTVTKNGKTVYKYIFGAKEIAMTHSVYDNEAVFVSTPLRIDDISNAIIDSVSLHVEEELPEGTSITYYVAKDEEGITEESALPWKKIDPVGSLNSDDKVVRFNGTIRLSNFIRSNPVGGEIPIIKPILADSRLLSNGDAYKIAQIDNDIIPESIQLEEGYNTTRIYDQNWKNNNYLSLDNWTDVVKTGPTGFNRIDTGNGFFSGLLFGHQLRSYMVETYVYCETDREIVTRDFIKNNPEAKTWDVKIFLNGEEAGNAPVGVDKLSIAWGFKKGPNHIAALIDIPAPTDAVRNPQSGSIELMLGDKLSNYGIVKLADWHYVDEFTLDQDEESIFGESYRFTIVDGFIVSRKEPTDNYRLIYSKDSQNAPESVRVKALLKRDPNYPNVTPSIDLYRLRFSYGGNS